MARADGDAWGHEARHASGLRFSVAADVETTHRMGGADGVGVAVARHADAADNGRLRAFRQQRPHEHGLVFGAVERLADDGPAAKEFCGVLRRDGDADGFDVQIGIDVGENVADGIRLEPPKMRNAIHLAIEIRHIDFVEIDQFQMADAASREHDGDVRAETAKPRNGDTGRLQLRLDFGRETRVERAVEFAFVDHGQPPWTNRTISSESPSLRMVFSKSFNGTISRFSSTATRFASKPASWRYAARLLPAASTFSPLIVSMICLLKKRKSRHERNHTRGGMPLRNGFRWSIKM